MGRVDWGGILALSVNPVNDVGTGFLYLGAYLILIKERFGLEDDHSVLLYIN